MSKKCKHVESVNNRNVSNKYTQIKLLQSLKIFKSIFRVHYYLLLYFSLKLQLYEQVVHLPGIEYAALHNIY